MNEQTARPEPTIIIIKKKKGHGGHHGGAWKVAYADFVTAMMALFIVLWLLNTSDNVKKSISSYFNDPAGSAKEIGSGTAGTGEALAITMNDMEKIQERLQAALKKSPEFEGLKDYMEFSVTGDGLRIEMLESESGMFFDSGSPNPSAQGTEMIKKLAEELGKMPNQLLIEGHTDAKPFGSQKNYTNWELSSERANAARRLMEVSGLREGQVSQVRGFADRQLRDPKAPEAAKNRRISVIVRYQDGPKKGSNDKDSNEHAIPAGEHAKVEPSKAGHH